MAAGTDSLVVELATAATWEVTEVARVVLAGAGEVAAAAEVVAAAEEGEEPAADPEPAVAAGASPGAQVDSQLVHSEPAVFSLPPE